MNFLGDSEFFSLSYAHDKAKNIFLYFFTKLKTDHLSYSIYKHNTIDIADPRSMQGEPHKRPHSPQSLCVSVVEHDRVQIPESLRFNSSWEFRIFSLSHAHEKMKNIFLYFFIKLKTYHLTYSITFFFCNNLFQLSSSAHKWWSWWTRNNKLGSCFVSASWLDYLLPLCMEGC